MKLRYLFFSINIPVNKLAAMIGIDNNTARIYRKI